MTRWLNRSVSALACGLMATTSLSSGGAYAQSDQPPIKIGVLGTFSGPLSTATITAEQGVDYAVEQFNKAGGLNGRKVEIVVRDTNGEPTKSVNFAKQLISNDGVIAIIGPANSGEGLAAVPVIAAAGVPNIVEGVLDPLTNPTKYPLAFRVANTNTQWIDLANDYLLHHVHRDKIAVIGDTSGYGTATVKQVSATLTAAGAPPVYTALIDPNQTDVTDEVAKAKAAGATAMSIWTGSTGLIARLLNARAEQNWDAVYIGHPAIMALPVRALLSKPDNWKDAYGIGFTNTTYAPNGKLPPETQQLLDEMRPRLGGKDLNFTFWWVLLGYDSVNLVLHAIKDAGSTDPSAMKKAFETGSFKGAYTTFTYTPTDHNGFPNAGLTVDVADSFRDGCFNAAL